MARYVLPVVGAAVGFAIGGPAGAQMGWALGAAAGSIVDPQVIKGPGIGDIAQQTSQAGVPRPIVFGTSKPIAGNIIASAEPVIVKKKQGGKGGPKVETESVYRTYAIRICEGPIDGVLRVWRNNVLVYDATDSEFIDRPPTPLPPPFMDPILSRNETFLETARFFLGDWDQVPSPDLEGVYGVGTTPAYRGTALMVMASEDVTGVGGAIPQWMFQVATGARVPIVANSKLWPWLPGAIEDPRNSLNIYLYSSQNTGNGSRAESGGEGQCAAIGATVLGSGGHTSMQACIDALNAEWAAEYPGDARTNSAQHFGVSARADLALVGSFSQFLHLGGTALTDYQRWSWFHMPIAGLEPQVIGTGTSDWDSVMPPLAGGTLVHGFRGGAIWDDWAPSLVAQKGTAYGTNPFQFGTRPITGGWGPTCSSGNQAAAYRCAVIRVHRTPGLPAANAELISGTFKVLQQFLDTSGDGTGNPQKHPRDPCIEQGDDRYNDAAYWVASYETARDAGLIAAGLTYGVHYPVVQNWAYFYYDSVNAETIPVHDIATAVCERVGLPFYDFTDILEDQTYGITITNEYPAYTILTALGQVFMFDGANIDAQLKLVKRGKNTVGSFTEDDLCDDHDVDFEQAMRQDSIAVPRVMHLNYYDVAGGLATSKQSSERPGDWRSTGEASMSSAVMMDANQAATMIAIQHKVAIEELRGEQELSLPDSFIGWTPTDNVFGTLGGSTYRLRIVMAETLDGMQKYKMVHDRQSIYTTEIEGIPSVPPTTPPSGVVGPTIMVPLDIHILQDADDNLGLIGYIAVSGVMPAWQGAKIEISYDGGANYVDVADITTGATIGQLLTPLPDHPHQYPDVTNAVVVEIVTPDAALEETTLVGMQNGLNRAAIGMPDTEIIQFAGADETSETFWELSNMLRGRKGSGARLHASGEWFVLLDRASLVPVPANLTDIGRTLTFRATSYGTAAESGTVVAVDFTGRSQIERAPNCLHVYRLGTDLHLSWKGVGRLGAGSQVAQGSRFAGYRVRISDGVDTITVDTTEQQLVQDVSALNSPATIRVVQLNTLTGEGPAIEVIA